ncbi:MAG: hypothetical protein H6737_29160 [Alphaproteobacteria bacterium]|nr:hypothetical protein [Alphaproteobacteria bacterium]
MIALLGAALAAPVICEPERAARLLEDARIAPDRVPVTQPNLLPGLARDRADGDVAELVDGLCSEGAALSLAPAERWETASYSAYSFVLTRSRTEGCRLMQDAAVLTVGVTPGEGLRYGVRARLPPSVTPIGDCEATAAYRQEEVLDGLGSPVRLVLVTDWEGEVSRARVVVRRATPQGWTEAVLIDPAPPRLLDGGGGPRLSLTEADGETWIVAHADREITPDGTACEARPGQTVWRWDGEAWEALRGRAALGRLADRGAWRLAGDDGWFLILAQDIEQDRELLEARMRRMQRRHDDPLSVRESASFPGMNAGFLIVSPDPWPTREEAEAARGAWGRRTGVYVKRGWEALDGCTR